jgi:hypothetical protein
LYHVYTAFAQPTKIRVAIIKPSMDCVAPLRFLFHQDCLEELEGPYEAVSYVWGAPILTFPVHHTTDGSRIFVTENLDHALRRLRRRLGPRWLWADAMCIDQKNDREKEVQIPLMVEIYRGAKRVLAWLHDGDDDIERGMRYLEQLPINTGTYDYNEEEVERSILLDVAKASTLPYFRRLWVVQEIATGSEVSLICGKSEISWSRIALGLNRFDYWSGSTQELLRTDGMNTLRKSAEIWRKELDQRDADLASKEPGSAMIRYLKHILDLVINFSIHGCTDDRDRIFAVHALSQRYNAHMAIDYSLDVYATYHRFALACMADDRTVDIIRAASASLGLDLCEGWPSWVPDWRRIPDQCRLWHHEAESIQIAKVEYIRNVNDDTIELEALFLVKSDESKCAERPATAHTKGMTCVGVSLSEFLSAMISLYRKSGPLVASTHENLKSLRSLLWYIWYPSRSKFKYDDLQKLTKYLTTLWETPIIHAEAPIEYETLCERLIAEKIEGSYFFTAKSERGERIYFCYGYGRAKVIDGDILMITENVAIFITVECIVVRPSPPLHCELRISFRLNAIVISTI